VRPEHRERRVGVRVPLFVAVQRGLSLVKEVFDRSLDRLIAHSHWFDRRRVIALAVVVTPRSDREIYRFYVSIVQYEKYQLGWRPHPTTHCGRRTTMTGGSTPLGESPPSAKSAVIATDLSAASKTMIESETGLSCLDRIGVDRIHLVTVVPSNVQRPLGDAGNELPETPERGASSVSIDDRERRVRGRNPRRPRTPHRRINGIAESIAADLILVGSRGKSPLENRVIGSTARNLARTTVVPLLVDRIERGVDDPDPIRRHLFKRTLFATDFSENAERAFQAFEYLRHATEEVTLVHVESPKDDAGGEADPDERLADLADRLGDWVRRSHRGAARRSRQGDPRC